MRQDSRISAAIEILETIHAKWAENSRAPADGILSDYLKDRRYMGSKDRGFVAEIVYFILRCGGALEWWLERLQVESSPRQIVILTLVLRYQYGRTEINELFNGGKYSPAPLTNPEFRIIDRTVGQALIHPDMPDWARYSMPEWLMPLLKRTFGDEMEDAMDALNQEAPLDLRVNTLKCKDRSDLITELDRMQYYGSPTPYSPLGVRIKKRVPVFTTEPFRNGWFEMQDEGSQIVAALVDAKPGQKVIDFCAGAGGKTLAIAAHMQNKGRILAWDVNESRLNQIRRRIARAGADNIIVHPLESEHDSFLKRHLNSADWVLVDSPCSGSGTWRRNPDLKWRFNKADLLEVLALQKNILHNAARLVVSGGRVVYATCSLFEEENEKQAQEFLVEHPDFEVEQPAQMWNKLVTRGAGLGSYLRLSPHKYGTDGFFAVIMKRK